MVTWQRRIPESLLWENCVCGGREVSGNSNAHGLAVVCKPAYVCGGVPDAEGNCVADGSCGNQPLCT